MVVAIQGFVEAPPPGTAVYNPFEIAGWVISPSGIAEVLVLLDGIYAATATLQQPRPDVCAVFPSSDPNCPNVGFRATVSAPPGMHSLQLLITSGGGQQTLLPLPPISLTVAGALLEKSLEEAFAGIFFDNAPDLSRWQAVAPGRDAVFVVPN
jgi:hypothetical protein